MPRFFARHISRMSLCACIDQSIGKACRQIRRALFAADDVENLPAHDLVTGLDLLAFIERSSTAMRNSWMCVAEMILSQSLVTIGVHHRAEVFAFHRLICGIAVQMCVCGTFALADFTGLGVYPHR